MSGFEETHLGLKLQKQRLVLVLSNAMLQATVVKSHTLTTEKDRKRFDKLYLKIDKLLADDPELSKLFDELQRDGKMDTFHTDLSPVLKNAVIRKAEDHDDL